MKTEREFTKDTQFHENRVEARERIREFQKKKRRAAVAAVCTFAVLFAALSYVMLYFYDRSMPLIAAAVALGVILLSVAAYIIAGGALCGGTGVFFKWCKVSAGWRDAIDRMETLEAKALDNTAFSGDVTKAEERLRKISEEIINM